ncbi:MAG: hypothetical protein A2V99_01245 [Spirochaetes bacterium RBG_16_67_19]|nr:MAG: hypothetical protein A2Y38_25320 [Spirochaetes bacterium GWB1_59_5]OHD74379.1 MAG: hypothetical protein A2V99_01245 [Spirochaetes bacterium RBG_16_67_19]
MGEILILAIELLVASLLIFSAHALRRRIGLGLFYALLGAITAVMSWVTDAGLAVRLAGVTFVVGSTAFYTSLLLGVFVVYVFDGPRSTRFAILTVAAVSALTPLTAAVLHLQARLGGIDALSSIPLPSLRINAASVLTTLVDLIFLAMAWEFLGKPRLHRWLRVYLTLLGVMWLDVALFATGAFAGTPEYLSIMSGTLISRLLTSVFALPLLAGYLSWQSRRKGVSFENRPVLTILARVAEVEAELTQAQREIQARQEAERQLRQALSEVKTLRGLLPICSHCKRIRDDKGYWNSIEKYLQEHSEALLSHGICPDCLRKLYPEVRLSDG